jgi:hypothetical protein
MPRKQSLSRFSQLASVIYPGQVDDETKRDMAAMAQRQKRKPPQSPQLIGDDKRGSCSQLEQIPVEFTYNLRA